MAAGTGEQKETQEWGGWVGGGGERKTRAKIGGVKINPEKERSAQEQQREKDWL